MRLITRNARLMPFLIVVLTMSLGLTACDSSESGPEPTPEPTPTSAAEGDNAEGPRGMVLGDSAQAPDFELIDDEGNPFRLSDHHGRVIAMFFGYTFCPDICPLTLMHMKHAKEELGDQADDALFLFVTVDPERDSPEQLHRYMERANHNAIGLTGDPDTLAQVWEDYSITVNVEPRDDGSYLIGHSAQIWLIDPDGHLAMILPPTADGDDLANDVRWLINGSSS